MMLPSRPNPNKQKGRATEIVAREAARFIAREGGRDSLITVVRAESVAGGEQMKIFVSVFPAERAPKALAYLSRQREAFSNYLKQHTHLRLPRVEFLFDDGQLSRGPDGN